MKIVGDTHTHTNACNHAYSTITENIRWAAGLGHRFLAITEHGCAMEGAPHPWYFGNLPKFVPRQVEGLTILRGCESNVLGDGSVDLPDYLLEGLDWVLASMHRAIMPEGLGIEKNTEAWIKIAQNPYIDCMGHMGHTAFPADYRRVVEACAQYGKVVEINASSPISRPGSEDNCREILRLCKEYGVSIVLSSDAHYMTGIGVVDWSIGAVEEIGYPPEQILNLDYGRMAHWLYKKKGLVLPD